MCGEHKARIPASAVGDPGVGVCWRQAVGTFQGQSVAVKWSFSEFTGHCRETGSKLLVWMHYSMLLYFCNAADISETVSSHFSETAEHLPSFQVLKIPMRVYFYIFETLQHAFCPLPQAIMLLDAWEAA